MKPVILIVPCWRLIYSPHSTTWLLMAWHFKDPGEDIDLVTVYPKKYAHGCCFAVLCCGYTLLDFPISIRLTSLALWQYNDCPSASKATLMKMDKNFMWIPYERLHNHNKAKLNKTVCIFLGIYCIKDNLYVTRRVICRQYVFYGAYYDRNDGKKFRQTNNTEFHYKRNTIHRWHRKLLIITFCLEIFTDANVYRQIICFHVSNDDIMASKQYLHYRPFVRGINHQRSIHPPPPPPPP